MPDLSQLIPRTALPHEVLRVALDALERGRRVVVASVVARHGSAPSTPGQKLCLVEDLTAVGTVGGGAVEKAVLTAMASALDDPTSTPRLDTFRLGPSLGMCCGGSVDILIEPMHPAVHVLVVGAGHVGTVTAPLLAALGFRVTLCDAREAAADLSRLVPVALPSPGAPLPAGQRIEEPRPAQSVRLVHADHDDPEVTALFSGAFPEAAAVVMTHDHQLDQTAVEWAITRGFGFVGAVGSRAKAARTRARLEAKGVPEPDLARVRIPIGIDIGARTPAEIAVSIAAELIAWRSGRQRPRWSAVNEALVDRSSADCSSASDEVDA
ncbi:XdhC family protein [Chondromyces apiculatus]|uniref:XdhC protein (Assists in molybdopterin insertion into xanthine dehydrogenase) n=1 Tax=Chondromyces apiculatus DSM 436 TaxID=1192034 RepID=A0A017TJD0_9BACT|nr:XdhC/CoxI family protein [Chondromyces apiculatus]EYF08987.1 XdhC protein (assists in molybdopterin insertion into xanthine dehydrogenase) [Chondromyces apiculatus DSM 436]